MFERIERWNGDICVNSRSTWIACYGIPIHAWNMETFQSIACRWGEYIRVDSDTMKYQSFVRGNVHIITDQMERIDECVKLQVGEVVHKIRVVEVELVVIPNRFCCCVNDNQKDGSEENLKSEGECSSNEKVDQTVLNQEGEEMESDKIRVEDNDVEVDRMEDDLGICEVRDKDAGNKESIDEGRPVNEDKQTGRYHGAYVGEQCMNGEMQQIEEENLDEEKRRFENCEGKGLVKWTCPNLGDVTEEKEMGWMPEKVDTVVGDSDGMEEKEMGWVSERVETIVVDSETKKS